MNLSLRDLSGRLLSATGAVGSAFPTQDEAEPARTLVAENLKRLRVVAWLLLLLTLLITLVDAMALQSLEPPATRETWLRLLGMRAALLLIPTACLLGSSRASSRREVSAVDTFLETAFVALGLLYAAAVAGLGQQLRPSIGAYLLGVFVVSAFIRLKGWKTVVAYGPAWILFTGLMLRVPEPFLRLPDLVNGTLMTVLAVILSHVSYRERLKDLSNTLVIERQSRELEATNRQLAEWNTMLRRLSYLDTLTETPNRRWFDEFLAREWARAAREGAPLSLIMADLDHFKGFNDRYGHQAGDRCLVQVASAFRSAMLRPGDFLARYGGEEFVIVLPRTDLEGARLVAERLMGATNRLDLRLPDGSMARVSVSLGVASARPNRKTSPDSLIARADQALYEAKAGGRARYACAAETAAS